jgi:hypothetical protein
MAESVLDGSFSHPNRSVSALTAHLQRRPLLPDIPPVKISELTYSRVFGGLREKSSASPSRIYNARYMCLVSKHADCSPNPIRIIHSKLMEMPVTHGFAPQRHQNALTAPFSRNQATLNKKRSDLFTGSKLQINRISRLVSPGKSNGLCRNTTILSMNSNSVAPTKHASVPLFSNRSQLTASSS